MIRASAVLNCQLAPLYAVLRSVSQADNSSLSSLTFGWKFNVFLIDLLHDFQVLLALAFRLVVVSCTAQSKNPTLLLDADLAFRGNQSFAGISIPNCLDTRLANIRASECKDKARFVSAEQHRMKPKVNPVASPDCLSCVDICPSVSQMRCIKDVRLHLQLLSWRNN